MDIKFHCSAERAFKNKYHQVRAFLYTDYYIEPHSHDFYEMNIILRGNGTHQIENAGFSVKTGDVFVIPPMTVHAYYNTHDLDVYHVLLHKNFILENKNESSAMPGFLQFIEIEPFLRQHSLNAMFLHLSPGQLLQLKNDLNFIDDKSFPGEEFLPLKQHTTWKMLYWLSDLLFRQMQAAKKSSSNKYETPIIHSLEYIHQNYADKITIDLLCKQTFLSRSTFLRSFCSICGCTPAQYLNNYRCEKALEMMAGKGSTKTEIANLCGFYDLSHMERMLKQYRPSL